MKASVVFSLLLSSLLFSRCDEKSEKSGSQELLLNTSVEDGGQNPSGWLFSNGDYETIWSDDHSFSGTRSLALTSDKADAVGGFWAQRVEDNIPHGERLKLTCQIKLDNVPGEGVSIAIRGDNEAAPVFFHTTQGQISITGNSDWQEFSVSMSDAVPDETSKIYIFLILLNNTTGTAYFDDISLMTF